MNPYTDSTQIQDQTAELLDRYDDRPDIAPTAGKMDPSESEPKYPLPTGQQGEDE